MNRLSPGLAIFTVFTMVASPAFARDKAAAVPGVAAAPAETADASKLANQATAAEKTGDIKAAMDLRVKARRAFNLLAPKELAKERQAVCDNLLLLGADYQKLGQFANSITVFNEALRVVDKDNVQDPIPALKARIAYADALSTQRHYREALAFYQQVLVGFYEHPKEKSKILYREAVLKTSLCYAHQGRLDEGVNTLKELVWLPGGDKETRNREIKTLVMFLKRLHRDLEASVYEQKLQ